MSRDVDIGRMALIALMGALTFVLTALVRIPIPATTGYVHLGDAAITFTAYAFGPWVALFAGGIGTAMADMLGYPQWAVFSLLIHGAQGLAMGWIVQRRINTLTVILSVSIGAAIVVAGYFAAGTFLVGVGAASGELLPNTLQGISGGVIGVPLYLAVRRAYPPLESRARRAR
ncbi:MAG TPA: ECF transporter S component [Anaerolineae bacterium]|nr:ECF transporter S component [Anaerolineae bacterium]HQI86639.1 ECF transporter S component [Anaerolineae bacterium]